MFLRKTSLKFSFLTALLSWLSSYNYLRSIHSFCVCWSYLRLVFFFLKCLVGFISENISLEFLRRMDLFLWDALGFFGDWPALGAVRPYISASVGALSSWRLKTPMLAVTSTHTPTSVLFSLFLQVVSRKKSFWNGFSLFFVSSSLPSSSLPLSLPVPLLLRLPLVQRKHPYPKSFHRRNAKYSSNGDAPHHLLPHVISAGLKVLQISSLWVRHRELLLGSL